MNAMALWCTSKETAELRPGLEGDGVLVETVFSGISRGTESLVFGGGIPASEAARMRGPAQEGDFPFPVKYGYSAVGQVREGTFDGQFVFALHPHQDHFRLPEGNLHPLPDGVPPGRAVLAANMETALNILWDSQSAAGDQIAVVGSGVVGSLVAYLAARLPGAKVTLVDSNPSRRLIAEKFSCRFAGPDEAPDNCDVVIHTSGTEAGLVNSLQMAGQDATVVEASWHGDRVVSLPLGADFHSKRLQLQSSQVGALPPSRSPRWTHSRRLSTAIELLEDSRLDVLISGETAFANLPAEYETILSHPDTLCHRVRYAIS